MSTAVVIGAGSGLSASLARKLAARGHDLVLGARNTDKLEDLINETGAQAVQMDGSNPADMAALFADLPSELRVAIYNPSARVHGSITDLDPDEVRRAVEITAFGSVLLGQQASKAMLANEPENGCKGTILFTGASAGVKGFANSSSFAMGKFALRGLAQSLARELHPKGIHIGHFVIDGGIGDSEPKEAEDRLHPDAIADTYFHVYRQPRSVWAWEIELRPWVEKF